jgi:2-oxoglutarate dehydrogenase E2 component (dihydrolipoamide succinyltransferase)
MSPTEETLPSDSAPEAASAQAGDAPADPRAATDAASDDTLSPAVRRLVRQFDLDVTGIHGTGPSGRIRVGDVMGLLAGRKDTGKRDAPQRPTTPPDDDPAPAADDAVLEALAMEAEPKADAEPAAHALVPMTTVFDCDVSRVLAHRRKLRRDNAELLTISYFLTALAAAVEKVPALAGGETPRFGVSLTAADGRIRSSVLEVPDTTQPPDERVRAVDVALRANLHTPLEHSSLLVHHYGESGSLLATPTPIGAGHAASVGIGRMRREIVVRVVDGVETPRVAACCHLSLSFFPDRVPLHAANQALAAAVAILESWPE